MSLRTLGRMSRALVLGSIACGKSADPSGQDATDPDSGQNTTTNPSDTVPEAEGGCDFTCCRDDVSFTIEDGRTTFVLTLELPGSIADDTLRCPAGPHDIPPYWTVTCDGASVLVDAEGIGFSASGDQRLALDGGAPQTWGDELSYLDCMCNCQPVGGNVIVLIDPSAGSSSGDTSSGDGSSTSDASSSGGGSSSTSSSSG